MAVALLGVVGLGMSYSLGRGLVAQKFAKGQSLMVQEIRAELLNAGMPSGCAATGTTTATVNFNLATGLTAQEATRTCTVQSVLVQIGAQERDAKLPLVKYESQVGTLLGPGTLTLGN
ncbi:hypothetical protein ACG0Z6_04790 [Roseateles sp. BYS180W]|uniref:Type II secretion system protein n=1 Tax=Roseateles rivi TaxID=3299028 RepID=A0ABW7FTA5_9BURK